MCKWTTIICRCITQQVPRQTCIFHFYCSQLYDTLSLLKQTPRCQTNHCKSPNNETSSLCSWIHVSSPTAFQSVALLCLLFTGGIPNLPVNSFLSPWMCNSTQFHNNGSKQWPTQSAHTNHHEHLEMQPISGRICSNVIMGNNTTLGTVIQSRDQWVSLASSLFYCTFFLRKKKKRIRPGVCYI